MNKMMAATISAGATAGAGRDRITAETGVDHAAADRDEDKEEGTEHLGEQAPSS
jgi:hypothetical protein